ncbi:MAG: T9SS type A sorting domain-containing protein [Flavobacteriales bacterium]|nr:T9SS type A sorting domain-containing protein [Flavobacteriia bacterium]NCP06970.1 T9SS type A sorting domain-containing protein [Flavobacteriales bacterium]PIV94712.1 MAG: endonuclease I [Flavobacteriaceae bacterium CG17_big_fil_post_rev_8_21_14_2_50_33_15]PIY12214.1 MAG: endonuclease I [Flavobacteriaceae bacterium CG_4_10_14_3_um_filter_33_47]PJB16157.1 MAG: endonuclease I [Flavobacteriaceae bacterium CG_4_9_14_3_um_filter_33_16]
MKKQITLILIFIISEFAFSQLVINELDCDTPSVDDKEFLELKSTTPNFPLDGYVVVFFNGSTNVVSGLNKSYLAIDLDGHFTDVNGLFLIGSNTVSPVPHFLIPINTIQNGADAVAIYQANAVDFPEFTTAFVDETLIDVLLYQTNDIDGTGLTPIFSAFNPSIQIVNEGAGNNTNSIQRNNDGSYFVGTPTPRQLNDGSGIVLNGLLLSVAQLQYPEGESFDITFTAEQPVASDLSFDISLNNGTFNTSDFTGNTSLTIPSGENSISTTISLTDDVDDEGDEVLKISLSTLPVDYLKLNDNIEIRVVDNDFVVAAWGTPLNPTFGLVSSTQPANYYASLDGLSSVALKQALQDIIANPSVVRAQTYADIIDILKEADQNPANSNEVWLLYTEQGRAKLDFQTVSNSLGKWNREHVYPRSRGGFFSIEADDTADGKAIYWTTEADSLRHGNSDAHALRAADGPENSIRNNQNYGVNEYDGPIGNSGIFKGDVARSIFYMVTRYNGLDVVNGYPIDTTPGFIGDLATLLEWHRNDPPDDYEMNRNNVVYTWQYNRNPFIDEPDLVEYLWGSQVGDIWNQSLSVKDTSFLGIKIFPNPTSNGFYIKGLKINTTIDLYAVDGRKIETNTISNDSYLNYNLSSGVYLLKISSEGKSTIKKLVIK